MVIVLNWLVFPICTFVYIHFSITLFWGRKIVINSFPHTPRNAKMQYQRDRILLIHYFYSHLFRRKWVIFLIDKFWCKFSIIGIFQHSRWRNKLFLFTSRSLLTAYLHCLDYTEFIKLKAILVILAQYKVWCTTNGDNEINKHLGKHFKEKMKVSSTIWNQLVTLKERVLIGWRNFNCFGFRRNVD